MSFHVWMYRMTAGKFGGEMRGFKVLILTTRGRKSGKTVSTPLGYFERDGGYIIVASNAGSDKHPSWYYQGILKVKREGQEQGPDWRRNNVWQWGQIGGQSLRSKPGSCC